MRETAWWISLCNDIRHDGGAGSLQKRSRDCGTIVVAAVGGGRCLGWEKSSGSSSDREIRRNGEVARRGQSGWLWERCDRSTMVVVVADIDSDRSSHMRRDKVSVVLGGVHRAQQVSQ